MPRLRLKRDTGVLCPGCGLEGYGGALLRLRLKRDTGLLLYAKTVPCAQPRSLISRCVYGIFE